ncbi:MAG: hypothetical protein RBT63_10745 [Bdellovibrionales bacterium]|nr:hypothetical protein [Bdellovibrionales bacterium]
MKTKRGWLRSAGLFLISATLFVKENSLADTPGSSIWTNALEMPVAIGVPGDGSRLEGAVADFLNSPLSEGFEFSQDIGDVEITDPFAIQLQGVSVKGHVSGRLTSDSRGLVVEASLGEVQVSVKRIAIHTVIQSRVGGVNARIRIDADCDGATIRWSRENLSFFTRAKILTSGSYPSVDFSQLALPAFVSQPEMSLSCRGPLGIESVIRQYAWQALQERWVQDSFRQEIEEKLEAAVAERFAPGAEAISLVSVGGTALSIVPGEYVRQAHGGRHVLKAQLKVALDRPISVAHAPSVSYEALAANALSDFTSSSGLTVSAQSKDLQTLLQAWFAPSGVWSDWVEARSIDGFRDLMDSRFSQFFAFPDLMRYSKNAPFWFHLQTTDYASLSCSGSSTKSQSASVQLPLGAWMFLKTPEQAMGLKQMVFFRFPTSLNIGLPEKGKRAIAATLRSLKLSARFDARYVATESPDTSISTSSIEEGMIEAVEAELSGLTAGRPSGVLVGPAIEGLLRTLKQTTVTCDPSRQVFKLEI